MASRGEGEADAAGEDVEQENQQGCQQDRGPEGLAGFAVSGAGSQKLGGVSDHAAAGAGGQGGEERCALVGGPRAASAGVVGGLGAELRGEGEGEAAAGVGDGGAVLGGG